MIDSSMFVGMKHGIEETRFYCLPWHPRIRTHNKSSLSPHAFILPAISICQYALLTPEYIYLPIALPVKNVLPEDSPNLLNRVSAINPRGPEF